MVQKPDIQIDEKKYQEERYFLMWKQQKLMTESDR